MNASSSMVALLAGTGPAALIAKSTVILVAGCVAGACAWRASAAALHLVRLATLGGCMMLLVMTPIAPTVGLHVAEPLVARSANAIPSELPSAPNVRRQNAPASVAPAIVRPPSTPGTLRTWIVGHGAMLAALAWLLGCAVVLMRCAAGWVAIARLRRHALPLGGAEWNEDVLMARGAAGEVRAVSVLTNEALSAPVTFGWRRAAILLPADAGAWTRERRRLVLIHELAHVARGDYLSQLVANLVTAALWFHPLAWFVAARLRADAERAADDVVLASGATGVTYATHLLEIARDASGLQLVSAVGVGMVRSSRLERRFNALLDARRSRSRLGSSAYGVAAFAALAIVTPVAGMRAVATAQQPVHPHAAAPSPPSSMDTTPPEPPASAPPGERVSDLPALRATMGLARSEIDSVLDKTIDVASSPQVTLDLPTGAGLIIHGWSRSQMRVHTELGGRDWQLVHVDLGRSQDIAQLTSSFTDDGSHSTELWMEVWLPRHADLSIKSAGGTIDLDHIDGRVTGSTGGGAIEIKHATGYVHLSTGGGAITVSDSRLNGIVSTGWGRIHIQNVEGDLVGITPTYDSRP